MTLLEVLKQSRAMWLWLYENPGKSKTEYLKGAGYAEPPIRNQCFICDWHIKAESRHCQGHCPIKWVTDEETLIEPYACENIESPYWIWLDEEEHEAASKIIDLHDEAIERCKKC